MSNYKIRLCTLSSFLCLFENTATKTEPHIPGAVLLMKYINELWHLVFYNESYVQWIPRWRSLGGGGGRGGRGRGRGGRGRGEGGGRGGRGGGEGGGGKGGWRGWLIYSSFSSFLPSFLSSFPISSLPFSLPSFLPFQSIHLHTHTHTHTAFLACVVSTGDTLRCCGDMQWVVWQCWGRNVCQSLGTSYYCTAGVLNLFPVKYPLSYKTINPNPQ